MPAELPTVLNTLGEPEAAHGAMLVDADGNAVSSWGGITASASFTPTASAYSANDIMDTAKEFAFTFANGDTIPSGSLIRIQTVIMKIAVSAPQPSEAGYALQCFSVSSPSALTDNAAWSLVDAADLAAYCGTIGLGTPVDLGGACYVKTPGVDLDIKLTGTSLFGQLQTLAGFTPTAAARQVLLYGTII